ncbi:MAG: GNAT family N-acetyltransferase [Promethearchaeati archaeon SRVP18_Atabeyarchaeia-1]
MSKAELADVKVQTLTRDRWPDLEKLFGSRGACGGCWCMWWRIKRSLFNQQKGEGNREALRKIVDSGEVPGILAYAGGEPIGWCSVAPRETYLVLDNSRTLGRVDDKPVWSVVCFYVAKPFRRKGVTLRLLETAIGYVRDSGGKIVEGYPVEPRKGKTPDAFAYTGLSSAFLKVGFIEVLRRSETRPIMRYSI